MSIPWHAPLERGDRVGQAVDRPRAAIPTAIRVPDDLPALSRSVGHLVLVLLLVGVLWNVIPRQYGSTDPSSALSAPSSVAASHWMLRPAEATAQDNLQPAVLPWTARSLRGLLPGSLSGPRVASRTSVMEYTVQPNDTVYGIAVRYGLQEETILWANSALENDPHMLRIGQVLTLLPVDGVYHTVENGDSVESIAADYEVETSAILEYPGNDLSAGLQPGQEIVVPGGVRPAPPVATPAPAVAQVAASPAEAPAAPPADAPSGSGQLIYPMAGTFSQGFGPYHRGVDWFAPIGTPIYAADAGYVSLVRYTCDAWGCGYGRWVVVDHGNGIATLYAHLSSVAVEPGQTVERGQLLGACGDVGKATGPHLHFEVQVNGTPVNPFRYLP